MHRIPSVVALSVGLVGLAATAHAQQILGKAQIQVNAYTPGDQLGPEIVVAPDGELVVTWTTGDAEAARRITINDVAAGPTFDITSRAADGALAADGSLLTVNDERDDGSSTGIGLRLFDTAGAPVGAELPVNTYVTGVQSDPAIDVTLTGDVAIVWSGEGSAGDDASGSAVLARLVSLGAEFQVNSTTSGDQLEPDVSASPDAGFVVVWRSDSSSGDDSDATSIQARRFDLDGNPLSGDFQVNEITTGRQVKPTVAVSPSNRFVVAWEHRPLGSVVPREDPRGFTEPVIHARVLDAAGAPLGQELTLTTPGAVGFEPRAAVPLVGYFAVVWSDFLGPAVDVRGALIDGAGALYPEGRFLVNELTDGAQGRPSVAAGRQGELVVVFESETSVGNDDDGTSLQLRRFGLRISDDAFETGDFAGWDEVVGAL